jgi:hypothetical protein
MSEQPKTTFSITIRGEAVTVEYTPEYLGGSDHFAYLSPHEPRKPHPLSETGYRSHFTKRAEVEAAGGPEVYALLYAEQELEQKERGGKRAKKKPSSHAAKAAGDPPPEERIVKIDASPFPIFPDGVKRDALPFPSELFRAGALSKRAPLPLSRAVLSRR